MVRLSAREHYGEVLSGTLIAREAQPQTIVRKGTRFLVNKEPAV